VENKTAVYLSGGAANADPALSLGGAKSSTRILSQSPSWDATPMPGATLVDGNGNTLGGGTLTYDPALGLGWQPPGVAFKTNLFPVTDGVENSVGHGSALLTALIASASLPGVLTTAGVTLVDGALNSVFDDVTKQDAVDGATEYRCLYITNQSAASITLTLWLKNRPVSGAEIAMGLEPQLDAAQSVADEATAPTGVTFSSPFNLAAGLSVVLLAGQSQALWIRRLVPALLITTAIDHINLQLDAS
jgi:hypothetical protein